MSNQGIISIYGEPDTVAFLLMQATTGSTLSSGTKGHSTCLHVGTVNGCEQCVVVFCVGTKCAYKVNYDTKRQ